MALFDTSPLTIIDPRAFNSLDDIKKKIILDSVTDRVSGMFTDILGNITSSINLSNPGVGSIISNIVGDVLQQFGITQDSLSYYRFWINPQKFDLAKQKMISWKYTGAGFEGDTRGEEMQQASYSGTTGSLVPKEFWLAKSLPLWNELASILNLTQDQIRLPEITNNPKLSAKYLKFILFDEFWKHNNNDLLVIWEDNCYVGKFKSYKFNQQETHPYEIFWNFNLSVYPDFTYNIFTGWITNSEFARIKSTFNQGLASQAQAPGGGLDFMGINLPSLKTDSQIQEDQDWFYTLGQFPYNKDKMLFFSTQVRDFKLGINNLTPVQFDELYKVNQDIDIYEETSTFNLQSKIKDIAQPNVTSQVAPTQTNTEVLKEITIINDYNNTNSYPS